MTKKNWIGRLLIVAAFFLYFIISSALVHAYPVYLPVSTMGATRLAEQLNVVNTSDIRYTKPVFTGKEEEGWYWESDYGDKGKVYLIANREGYVQKIRIKCEGERTCSAVCTDICRAIGMTDDEIRGVIYNGRHDPENGYTGYCYNKSEERFIVMAPALRGNTYYALFTAVVFKD